MKKQFAIIGLLMFGLITNPLFAKKSAFEKDMDTIAAPEEKEVNKDIDSIEHPESDMPDDWKGK